MIPINQIPKKYPLVRSAAIGAAIAIGVAIGYNTILSIQLNKKRLARLESELKEK